jgi:type II secretory pathway pseudopilin PulG
MGKKEKNKHIVRRLLLPVRAAIQGEGGIGLVEALVAVAILGLALTALLSAMSTGSMATSRTEERVTAENLARSQLEYVKSQPYRPLGTPYPTVTPYPDDYSVAVTSDIVPDSDPHIEKITVTISRAGKELLTVDDYKVDR